MKQTELASLALAKENIKNLLKMKADDTDGKMDSLKNLVVFEDVTEEERKEYSEAGFEVFTLKQLVDKGQEIKNEGNDTFNEPKAESVYMLSYTSGTTGDPKGVMLTHKMVLSTQHATVFRVKMTKDDTFISYLPAAHSYEQVSLVNSLIIGTRQGFYAGNPLTLTEDMQVLKPTIFCSVPRLYNRIYGKI